MRHRRTVAMLAVLAVLAGTFAAPQQAQAATYKWTCTYKVLRDMDYETQACVNWVWSVDQNGNRVARPYRVSLNNDSRSRKAVVTTSRSWAKNSRVYQSNGENRSIPAGAGFMWDDGFTYWGIASDCEPNSDWIHRVDFRVAPSGGSYQTMKVYLPCYRG